VLQTLDIASLLLAMFIERKNKLQINKSCELGSIGRNIALYMQGAGVQISVIHLSILNDEISSH
jgi:hypothetical protein